jgi:hypothetical protein
MFSRMVQVLSERRHPHILDLRHGLTKTLATAHQPTTFYGL